MTGCAGTWGREARQNPTPHNPRQSEQLPSDRLARWFLLGNFVPQGCTGMNRSCFLRKLAGAKLRRKLLERFDDGRRSYGNDIPRHGFMIGIRSVAETLAPAVEQFRINRRNLRD